MLKPTSLRTYEITEALESGTAFDRDRLDLERIAKRLTNLLAHQSRGLVVTLTAPWGQGKTWFCRHWQRALEDGNFDGSKRRTIWFNAWTHDYADDPLLSFIGAIDEAIGVTEECQDDTPAKKAFRKTKDTFKKVVRASPKIALNYLLRGGLSCVTDTDGDGETDAKAEIDAALAMADAMLDEQLAKQNAIGQHIADFKTSLSDFVEEYGNGQPVFVFIDELDRCRPSFAVELLERIKHLFDVPNVVFVLAVARKQLSHAAASVLHFPPDRADDYLARFVDLEYELPEADPYHYVIARLHDSDPWDVPAGDEALRSPARRFAALSGLLGLTMRQVTKALPRVELVARGLKREPDSLGMQLHGELLALHLAKSPILDAVLHGVQAVKPLDVLWARSRNLGDPESISAINTVDDSTRHNQWLEDRERAAVIVRLLAELPDRFTGEGGVPNVPASLRGCRDAGTFLDWFRAVHSIDTALALRSQLRLTYRDTVLRMPGPER
ncbi:MAG: P-loop NTPase fold protein [Planctomycetota bacterium]